MDHSCYATSCKGATGEANQNDLIARDIVGSYEGVGFAYILQMLEVEVEEAGRKRNSPRRFQRQANRR